MTAEVTRTNKLARALWTVVVPLGLIYLLVAGSGSTAGIADAPTAADDSPATVTPESSTVLGDEPKTITPGIDASSDGTVETFASPDGRNAYVEFPDGEGAVHRIWIDDDTGRTVDASSDAGPVLREGLGWRGALFVGFATSRSGDEMVVFGHDGEASYPLAGIEGAPSPSLWHQKFGVNLASFESWEYEADSGDYVDPTSGSAMSVNLRHTDDQPYASGDLTEVRVPLWDKLSHGRITTFANATDELIEGDDGTRVVRRIPLQHYTIEIEVQLSAGSDLSHDMATLALDASRVLDVVPYDFLQHGDPIVSQPVTSGPDPQFYEIATEFGPGTGGVLVAVDSNAVPIAVGSGGTALRTTSAATSLRSDSLLTLERPPDCAQGCEMVAWISQARFFHVSELGARYVFFGDGDTTVRITQIDRLPPEAFS